VSQDRAEREATRSAAELEPTAHVYDGPDEYRVDVDAPGLGAGDFEVSLAGRLLHVTGRDLRGFGSDAVFEFAFRLPDLVTGDRLRASFEAGKLVVRAPVEPAEPRVIEIESPPPVG
jgi:HSP20 family molecular chaperone IbpA